MDFIALDIETANPDISSICQIGLAEFENGKLKEQANILVNPDDYFAETNIFLHGITEELVINAPKIEFVVPKLFAALEGKIVVTHTNFDRASLNKAAKECDILVPTILWLDSAKVARRTWPEVARRGYGLANLALINNIHFKHHDAADDARAAGLILLNASEEKGFSLKDWLIETAKPLSSAGSNSSRIKLAGNQEGVLFGEKLVFTGRIRLIRNEAAALAANAGCDVSDNVNKETTILVVGDQDIKHMAFGETKSSKHRKAEELILKGHEIRIIGETDFFNLISRE